jgi:hypothetical protein
MIISLGEIEKFTNDFLEKNPDKTVEDAVEAFMRMKQK